ncbi:hapless 2 [Anoplophora glabripennis]|uniref:hapless 2 n=1 Tax=Anoplophora glabripennis TaxID=217634 RepID=UPI0008756BDC|nr:hapless 2 [Anoplophora glabripennis]
MFDVKVFVILFYIQFSTGQTKTVDTDNIQNILMDEERNARCCAQHMDCCKNSSETTSFEVRALFIKCVNSEQSCEKSASYMRKTCEKSDEQFENTLRNVPQEISTCDKKIKLTVKLKNVGTTNIKNQYIIIDHVFDPLTEKKQKLLNPYVLKIKQEPILQIYGLAFENMVNSEAKEKVVNKNDEGYTGCSVDADQNPTCGAMKYEDEVVPYSTGFCCPCTNDHIEQNTEDTNFTSDGNDDDMNPKKTRNAYSNIDVASYNKRNNDHYEFTGKAGKAKEDAVAINAADNGDNAGLFQSANDQRLIPFSDKIHFVQKRGGQDCSDNYTPPNVNPDTYHDSTHCLEFSDLWYSVYCIQKPRLFHSLQFQIYEKCQDHDGSFKWTDLTNNSAVTIGTDDKFYANEENTLIASYMARDVNPCMFSINYKIKKLLIPDASKIVVNDSYPELKGGPEQYLVVNENQVQTNGKSCNTAGVGYEAFVKQPNRCSKPKGTCLHKQPKHLFTHDQEAETEGKNGSYFLKYHGSLADDPIESTENSPNKTLRMLYTESYTSILDLEIKADNNVVLRPNSLAIITEVYVDSSSPKRTSIIVKVFNSGLVSSLFFVALTHCPLDLPASFSSITSKPALIAPQQQHVFNLKIECPLPATSFFCAVEVLNDKVELIAFRKIRLEKLDRCICTWHCLCACLLSDKGLKCKPMSLQHYHAAGFQGSLPVPLHVVHYTFWDDVLSIILYILIFLFLTLLIMGLAKAIAGCFMVAVGLWGLDQILDLPKRMNQYYESDLKHRKIVYDENGWPIHPDTRERVRNISLPAEFSLNTVFFFIYPLYLLWMAFQRLCVSPQPKNYSEYDLCTCKSDTLVTKRGSSLQVSLRNGEDSRRKEKENKPDKMNDSVREPKYGEEKEVEPNINNEQLSINTEPAYGEEKEKKPNEKNEPLPIKTEPEYEEEKEEKPNINNDSFKTNRIREGKKKRS